MRMKATALQAATLAAALFASGAVRAEQTPLGVWIDHTGRGAVEIKDCNGKLCGYVAWVKDPKDAEGCGEQIIGNVKSVGGGKWDNGWIYDPDTASKYDVELTPKGDTMTVLGYAGSKWLSETMTWKRAPAGLQKCTKGEAAAAGGTPAATAAQTPAAKPDAKPDDKTAKVAATEAPKDKTAAADSKSAEPKSAEPKSGGADTGKTLKAATPEDNDTVASLDAKDDDNDPKPRGKKRMCKMHVPYIEMVVTFPCDGDRGDRDDD